MKLKLFTWIFVIGYVLDFIGSWMKLTHQALGDQALLLATLLKVCGLIGAVASLLSHPRVKEFLKYDQYNDSFKG